MKLSSHKGNVFSQFGEDGILAKLFGDVRGFCVEFGASDGLYMSNTANLIRNHGWRGVLIEGAPNKFAALQQNYPAAKWNVRNLPHVIGLEGEYTLDRILAREAPLTPKEFELLSIDIDGCDYHVWEGIKDYRPKVVVVEFNPTIPAEVEFVQPRDLTLFQGSSLLALTRLAASKGYALVACTDTNAIFIRPELFDISIYTADVEESIATLWTDRKYVTYVFSLYDGTVKLAGSKQLPWHGVSFDEEKLQVLTPEQRKFSGAL